MRRKIHKPYNRLKGILREKGITYADLAEILEISETAVGYKINGMSDFYLREVNKLEDEYNIGYNFFSSKSCELNNTIRE